jgi:hypothetical protein
LLNAASIARRSERNLTFTETPRDLPVAKERLAGAVFTPPPARGSRRLAETFGGKNKGKIRVIREIRIIRVDFFIS